MRPAADTIALDDGRSSTPVLTFHLLSGRAGVSCQYARTYSRTYWTVAGGDGVVWASVGRGEELVEVVARRHNLPIGAHRKEELER